MKTGIIDIEYYLPDKILDNDAVADSIGKWKPSEIRAKIGIAERRVAGSDEYSSDLAVEAAERLLSRWPPQIRHSIDLFIFCTQTPDYVIPTTACIVQRRLNLSSSVAAFDINLGCSGFVYALSVVRSMISSGDASLALICCSDTYCKWIGSKDAVTRPIFGDGSAAILLGRLRPGKEGIGSFIFGTDGSGWDKLIIRGSGGHGALNSPTIKEEDRHLYMNGPEIFRFTTVTVKNVIYSLLKKLDLKKESVQWFVLHQASGFILKHLIQTCGLDIERTPIMMENTGNTISASIPIVLKALMKSKIQPGDRLVLVGFGAGYSWACCDVTWQHPSEFEVLSLPQ